ncbi:hypothetical protein HJFPF1_03054 [Paramyrothecium foliicola]|nr:hypothetical protein HJFPF1_03054 [Paramyrothecium foliicola]
MKISSVAPRLGGKPIPRLSELKCVCQSTMIENDLQHAWSKFCPEREAGLRDELKVGQGGWSHVQQ